MLKIINTSSNGSFKIIYDNRVEVEYKFHSSSTYKGSTYFNGYEITIKNSSIFSGTHHILKNGVKMGFIRFTMSGKIKLNFINDLGMEEEKWTLHTKGFSSMRFELRNPKGDTVVTLRRSYNWRTWGYNIKPIWGYTSLEYEDIKEVFLYACVAMKLKSKRGMG